MASASPTSTSPLPSIPSQEQSVSAMIRQGFISDPLISSTAFPTLPSFRGLKTPTPTPNPNYPVVPLNPTPFSPTLSQIMSSERHQGPKPSTEYHRAVSDQVSSILCNAPFRTSDQWGDGDVSLTIRGKAVPGDGESSSFVEVMSVHKYVLAAKSKFFAQKLHGRGFHLIEILDCDDVVAYVEAIVLMYYDELTTKLMGKDVSKILTLLKIFSDINFVQGIKACLDYLEVVPWTEDEEESVISVLQELQIYGPKRDAVLQRVIVQPLTSSSSDEMCMRLLLGILQAKDDKARKMMKTIMFGLLEDETEVADKPLMSKDALYQLCHRCITSLKHSLSEATSVDESGKNRGALMDQIARQAENMQWIARILILQKLGAEFVELWADQKELSVLHSKIPAMYRHEISKVTANLFVSIGKGNILVPKENKLALLSTWLQALYDDFRWMRSSGKSFDRNLVQEGLCQTILTLPMPQQQSILLDWFDRFLDKGDDCPDIQDAFEVWWRRSFMRQLEVDSRMQITVCDDTQ